jgi:hypothetical protein
MLIELMDADTSPAAPGFSVHVAHLADAGALDMIKVRRAPKHDRCRRAIRGSRRPCTAFVIRAGGPRARPSADGRDMCALPDLRGRGCAGWRHAVQVRAPYPRRRQPAAALASSHVRGSKPGKLEAVALTARLGVQAATACALLAAPGGPPPPLGLQVSSDHSPAPPDIKAVDTGNFLKAWGGISGVQYLLQGVQLQSARIMGLGVLPLGRSPHAPFVRALASHLDGPGSRRRRPAAAGKAAERGTRGNGRPIQSKGQARGRLRRGHCGASPFARHCRCAAVTLCHAAH